MFLFVCFHFGMIGFLDFPFQSLQHFQGKSDFAFSRCRLATEQEVEWRVDDAFIVDGVIIGDGTGDGVDDREGHFVLALCIVHASLYGLQESTPIFRIYLVAESRETVCRSCRNVAGICRNLLFYIFIDYQRVIFLSRFCVCVRHCDYCDFSRFLWHRANVHPRIFCHLEESAKCDASVTGTQAVIVLLVALCIVILAAHAAQLVVEVTSGFTQSVGQCRTDAEPVVVVVTDACARTDQTFHHLTGLLVVVCR